METKFRCNCPITSSLDVLGDKWTLVIVKQMLVEHKKTFKDFTESNEAIASNILSSRLKMLEKFKIISKEKLIDNKKTNIYCLTEKGISLAPIILELFLWSSENMNEFHPEIMPNEEIEHIKKNKEAFINTTIKNYKK